MKKIILRKIIFITLIFIMFFSLQNMVLANFNPDIYTPETLTREKATTVFFMGEKLFGFLRNVAAIVAILTIATIGVKYIYASAEQKAEYKATLVPWLIGAVLVVMVTGLLGIIQSLAQKI